MSEKVPLFIDGECRQSLASEWLDVTNPATNEIIGSVPVTLDIEMQRAIESALQAQKDWKDVPVSERARVMLRYQHLLKEHHDDIAELLSKETGKTLADAREMFGVALRSSSKPPILPAI